MDWLIDKKSGTSAQPKLSLGPGCFVRATEMYFCSSQMVVFCGNGSLKMASQTPQARG